MPHLTIDPIVAGAEVVTAMQSIIFTFPEP